MSHAPPPEELDARAVHDVVLRVHLQRVMTMVGVDMTMVGVDMTMVGVDMTMVGVDGGGRAAACQCTSVSSFQLSHSVVAPLSIMKLPSA